MGSILSDSSCVYHNIQFLQTICRKLCLKIRTCGADTNNNYNKLLPADVQLVYWSSYQRVHG